MNSGSVARRLLIFSYFSEVHIYSNNKPRYPFISLTCGIRDEGNRSGIFWICSCRGSSSHAQGRETTYWWCTSRRRMYSLLLDWGPFNTRPRLGLWRMDFRRNSRSSFKQSLVPRYGWLHGFIWEEANEQCYYEIPRRERRTSLRYIRRCEGTLFHGLVFFLLRL